jgi:hypothetical protein
MNDCNMDGEEDEQNEDEEGDDYVNNYEWYNFELTNDEADDAGQVCKVLNGWDEEAGKSQSYKGKTVYEEGTSGNLYNYKKSKSSSDGASGGSIAAIVIFVLLIVGVVGFFAFGKVAKNDKKAPLINANEGGQMA